MKIEDKKILRKYLKDIKKLIPLENHYVKLSFKKMKDDGVCYGPYENKKADKKTIYIVINNSLNFTLLLDTLIHEYAHALVIDKGHDERMITEEQQHGIIWGKCYSMVYRAWLKIEKEIKF
jgi:hypothetical protein